MKKKLLFSLVAVAFGFIQYAQAQKQSVNTVVCTPDPLFNKVGVSPDTTTNLDTACVNKPYSETFTMNIPDDTCIMPTTCLMWDSTVLVGVSGLPPGFTLQCWNQNGNVAKENWCSWKGLSKGCAILTGTATSGQVGTWPLTLNTNSYLAGSPTPVNVLFQGYRLVIVASGAACTAGVNELSNIQSLTQNNPNPFNDRTTISFSAKENAAGTFKVFNLLGAVVHQSALNIKQGTNKIELEAKEFNPGVYFYSVISGNSVITKKMVVSGN